jgi:hypothetical protein
MPCSSKSGVPSQFIQGASFTGAAGAAETPIAAKPSGWRAICLRARIYTLHNRTRMRYARASSTIRKAKLCS